MGNEEGALADLMPRAVDLISLVEAAKSIPGADAGTLKRKARAGKLRVYRIGKAYLTTRADIATLVEACRVVPKGCGSGDTTLNTTRTEGSPTAPAGSTSMELASAALDSALAQATKIKRKR